MKKFLVLCEEGSGLGIAWLLQEEGHDVVAWCKDSRVANDSKGLVRRVHDWDFEFDRETFVLADGTGNGMLLDMLRDGGFNVFGGSHLADRLEMDRAYATQVMAQIGIRVPQSVDFEDWESARVYAVSRTKAEPELRLVFKPSGRNSGVIPSYVSKGLENLLGMLQHYESTTPGRPEFALQDFIEGVDVSTEGWFDGRQFLRPFNHTLEQKSLMNQNLGKSGGCTGNVVWGAVNDTTPLVKELLKTERFLRDAGYGPGVIDLNALVTGEGDIYGLEFTPRFGYDATPTLLYQLFDGDFGEWLAFRRQDVPLRSGFAAGIRITVPPWPTEEADMPEGLPINEIEVSSNFYPYSLEVNEQNKLVSTGGYGSIGIALGHNDTIRGALRQAYKIAEAIEVPYKQYRTDLVQEFEKDLAALQAAGVIE